MSASDHSAERTCIEEFLPERGGLFVDVGANVGDVCQIARNLRPSVHIIGCEPWPSNYAALVTRGVADTTWPMALAGESAADVSLYGVQESEPELLASLHRREGFNHGHVVKLVRTVRLDELLRPANFSLTPPSPTRRTPSLIKIDVEGAEGEVLHGMRELLRQRIPRCVVFEHLPPSCWDFMGGWHPTIRDIIKHYSHDYTFERWTDDLGWIPHATRKDGNGMWRMTTR